MYKYFVSYLHNQGHGRCEITTAKKIKGIEDIERLEKIIFDENGEKVTIMYFQLLDRG